MFGEPFHSHFVKVNIPHAEQYPRKRAGMRTVQQHFVYRFFRQKDFPFVVHGKRGDRIFWGGFSTQTPRT